MAASSERHDVGPVSAGVAGRAWARARRCRVGAARLVRGRRGSATRATTTRGVENATPAGGVVVAEAGRTAAVTSAVPMTTRCAASRVSGDIAGLFLVPGQGHQEVRRRCDIWD